MTDIRLLCEIGRTIGAVSTAAVSDVFEGEPVDEGGDVLPVVAPEPSPEPLAGELGLQFAEMAMSYYEREPRGGAPTTHQEMARCAEVVAGAAASARPGTSLAEVVAGWPGSPAALAAYVS